MNFRILGRTGLKVSEIGLGCWALGGHGYGPVSEEDVFKVLTAAWTHGINFFDTADCYGDGRSEELLGRFLADKPRGKVIVATKAGHNFYDGAVKKNFSRDYLQQACEKSLQRLKLDYIDLWQLHNPTETVLREGEVFNLLQDLKQQGKIRFAGASVRTEEEALICIDSQRIDTLQIVFNLIDQRMSKKVFARAREAHVGLIIREPLANGYLSGKFSVGHEFTKGDHRRGWSAERRHTVLQKVARIQTLFATRRISLARAALEYVLDYEDVATVIPGAKTEAQVVENLRAVTDPRLRSQESSQFRELYEREPLFQKFVDA